MVQAEDGIRDTSVTGVQTCALPISPVQVVDRDVAARVGEAAVDPPDELLDVPPQLAVLAHLAAARHGNLNEREATTELGALRQQVFDRPQALDDPLRVVEPVDAEKDAAATELR